jgi:hypothetical protein
MHLAHIRYISVLRTQHAQSRTLFDALQCPPITFSSCPLPLPSSLPSSCYTSLAPLVLRSAVCTPCTCGLCVCMYLMFAFMRVSACNASVAQALIGVRWRMFEGFQVLRAWTEAVRGVTGM